ncbi:hypothetical protein WCLP8_5210013 [uncultured Gammaproteobacteria bacterium]
MSGIVHHNPGVHHPGHRFPDHPHPGHQRLDGYPPVDRFAEGHFAEGHFVEGHREPPPPQREPIAWGTVFWAILSLLMAVGFIYWLDQYDHAQPNRMRIGSDPNYVYDENLAGQDFRPNRTQPTINWGGKRLN